MMLKAINIIGNFKIIFVIILFSCNENKNNLNNTGNENKKPIKDEIVSDVFFDDVTNEDLEDILKNKDKDVYFRIVCLYLNGIKKDYKNFLPYVEFMAKNSKDGDEHLEIYYFYLSIYNNNKAFTDDSIFLKFNEKDRKHVLEHLNKGVEKDNSLCIETLERLKKKGYLKE